MGSGQYFNNHIDLCQLMSYTGEEKIIELLKIQRAQNSMMNDTSMIQGINKSSFSTKYELYWRRKDHRITQNMTHL